MNSETTGYMAELNENVNNGVDVAMGGSRGMSTPAGVPFKGYTLEEMRVRRVVNELKIQFVKERLKSAVRPDGTEMQTAVKSYAKGFDAVFRYFDVAMLAFNMSRRVFRFFGKFRSSGRRNQ